jgi:hypothetical protein
MSSRGSDLVSVSEPITGSDPDRSAPDGSDPDGVLVILKQECPTCVLVAPVVEALARTGAVTAVAVQDDPAFLTGIPGRIDDRGLEVSWRADIDTVPTVIRRRGGEEVERIVGWSREQWVAFFGSGSGVEAASAGMPEWRPGCGSMTVDPLLRPRLEARFSGSRLRSRRVELADSEDEWESMFARGWSDGLPVVPPTPERVLAMLAGTTRAPDEVVAVVPPDLVECTVEKVAVNAVMAGCRPEYLPVVLAAVEAACTAEFNAHGLLATTYFSGPLLIVNGPIRRAIGMNSGVNALGQGNRANSTIGRALQLVIRNVGGGLPGGVDRATLGNPGKVGWCFAEDEEGSPWEPLSVERGVPAGRNAVTLFSAEGPRAIVDQKSREPESLARSLAAGLRSVGHPKLVLGFDAIVVLSPEHARVFREAGWTKARTVARLHELLTGPADELVEGAGGIAEGLPAALAGHTVPKFRPNGLWLVHAGGGAGMFSAIIGGWVNGAVGSEMTTKEIQP